MDINNGRPYLGFGLGLRTEHYHHVLEQKPDIDWFEIISENYMVAGGKPKYFLHAIREHYPMVMHGVSLSIGSSDPLDINYLKSLRSLIAEVQPEWVSDHLCWTSAHGINTHDLMPLPYTEEAINHVVERVQQAQEFLGRPILLENVSSYVTYKHSVISEWEFFNEIVARSGCLMLLDINNIYVSSRNHNFDPLRYIDSVDKEKVFQFHLAGHSDYGDYVIDTHDHPVVESVWSLYRYAIEHLGAVSTMIERDDQIPPFEELEAELNYARGIASEFLPQTNAQFQSSCSNKVSRASSCQS
ncbi:DUF692 domain-containing protein [Aliikangiella coralliicola]|uniref:UPF0276 protein FLL46_15935 n=1 Tax=Aliikangiella coralliicola TaxID=2592383 RepID=A0A545UAA4_9GAMM|nr:DUF692 domain-containing protein [Aliikangiella coralliicola]TQV86408.1 DUF692 domain-containing protein [Aliikangiella coralliicola]